MTRRVGANGTFYIIKDEDKLAMAGSEDTHVQVPASGIHTIISLQRMVDYDIV